MFVGITNTPRAYAWGSTSAMAELLGTEPSGGTEAELWLGAHPLNPSIVTEPASAGGAATLDAFIAADPDRALGPTRRGDTLPFLLKVLAADEPLSIQAHPSPEQAEEGFAREEAQGVALDAPHRSYKDELPKPELALALSGTFEALAGFRDVAFTRLLVAELRSVAAVLGDDADLTALDRFARLLEGAEDEALARALAFALSGTDEAVAVLGAVSRVAGRMPTSSSYQREYATIVELAERHPGDAGALVALLLNRLSLVQGQALYLPSGNMHAYLRGLAIEIMAASDNVIRGGLTTKHIDIDELQRVVRFEAVPPPVLRPEEPAEGVDVFRPDVPYFRLVRVGGVEEAIVPIEGPAIVLALGGAAEISGESTAATLAPGGAAFVTPDEGVLTVRTGGLVFVATTNP